MDKVKTLIKSSPVVIALIYIVVGFFWIQFSDQWVFAMLDDPESITRAQSLKGWFFVAASGFIIFLLVRQNNKLLGNVIHDLNLTSKKFESTIENAPVGIAHHNTDEKWLVVNQALCDLLGYQREELMKLGFDDFVHPDDLERGRDLDKKLTDGEIRYYETEKRYIRKDGSEFPGFIRKAAIYDENQSLSYFIAILEDITRQKIHEEKIQSSLREKEILLAEVHHRVKNNLALISALFNLQNMHVENKELIAILHKNETRIKCLALIHENFSQNEDSADINFGAILDKLTNFLISSLDAGRDKVLIHKKIDTLLLNINIAIPVSLIFTELMMKIVPETTQNRNSLIDISIEAENGTVSLLLRAPEHQHADNSASAQKDDLTFTIIDILVAQIEGNLEIISKKNTTDYSLIFSNKEIRGGASHLTNQDFSSN